jgi:hypothetical protein
MSLVAGLLACVLARGAALPACTCVVVPDRPPPSVAAVRDQLAAGAVAIEGLVVAERYRRDSVPGRSDSMQWLRTLTRVVTVRVERRWQGPVGDTLVVATPAWTTACGADLQVGATYLFLEPASSWGRDELSITKCRPPRHGRAASELAVLLDAAAERQR